MRCPAVIFSHDRKPKEHRIVQASLAAYFLFYFLFFIFTPLGCIPQSGEIGQEPARSQLLAE
jgi:hypothetical protein